MEKIVSVPSQCWRNEENCFECYGSYVKDGEWYGPKECGSCQCIALESVAAKLEAADGQ